MTKERAKTILKSKLEWAKLNQYPYISKEEVELIELMLNVLENDGVFHEEDGEIVIVKKDVWEDIKKALGSVSVRG